MAGDKNRPDQSQGEIVIYQAEDGLTKVECRFVDEDCLADAAADGGIVPHVQKQHCGAYRPHL